MFQNVILILLQHNSTVHHLTQQNNEIYMDIKENRGVFKFNMTHNSIILVTEIFNNSIKSKYVVTQSMTKTIKANKVMFQQINGDCKINQVQSKKVLITKDQLISAVSALDGFIFVNSLCVLDVLSSAFAIKILKQGWTKLERDIYIGTTIMKQIYQFFAIFGTYIKNFGTSSNNLKKILLFANTITTPCLFAWAIAEIFFVIECIYFSTFPKIIEVEDNKLLPGIQAKYVFHHVWLTSFIFVLQVVDISMDFTDIAQTFYFVNENKYNSLSSGSSNFLLKFAFNFVEFATNIGTTQADGGEEQSYMVDPKPYYIWICFAAGIFVQIVTDPSRGYVLKLALQIEEIQKKGNQLNGKVFMAKMILFFFGEILNFVNNAYSAFFAIITGQGSPYQPFSIMFLALFYEVMQIRIMSYTKHRIIIFYDYIKNVVKTDNKCCTFFSFIFSMSIIFFKYAQDFAYSHLKLKYLYITVLNIVGLFYFLIAPVILVALFVVVFICQFSVNILTLFVTQFMFPFPFFQNLFGMTDNELKFQQLKYLYSTPLNLLYITVVTLIVYEVPLLTLEITDQSFRFIWLGGMIVIIGQILEYMVYQRQSPTEDCLIDFEQDPDFYCSFLMQFQTMGMTFIPFVGQALNVFSKFMNSPPLARQGEREITMGYFLAVLRFYCFVCFAILMIQQNSWYWPHGVVVFACLAFDAFEESKEIVPNSRSISLQDINLTKYKDFYRAKKKDANVFKPKVVAAKEQKPVVIPKKKLQLPKRVPQQKLIREFQIKEAEKQQILKFLENHPAEKIDTKMHENLKENLNIEIVEQIVKREEESDERVNIERLVREIPYEQSFWVEDNYHNGTVNQNQKSKLNNEAQESEAQDEEVGNGVLFKNKKIQGYNQEEFEKLPPEVQEQLLNWEKFMVFDQQKEDSENYGRRSKQQSKSSFRRGHQ